jgi:hypothetical protein
MSLVPLAIAVFQLLALLMDSVFWRLGLALVLALPLAVAWGILAYKIAAPLAMLAKVHDTVDAHKAHAWAEWTREWDKMQRDAAEHARREAAEHARRESQERQRARSDEPSQREFSTVRFMPLSRPTCHFCESFITTDALGDPPDASIRSWPSNSGLCQVLERTAPFAPIKAKLVKGNRAACEAFVQGRGKTEDGWIVL